METVLLPGATAPLISDVVRGRIPPLPPLSVFDFFETLKTLKTLKTFKTLKIFKTFKTILGKMSVGSGAAPPPHISFGRIIDGGLFPREAFVLILKHFDRIKSWVGLAAKRPGALPKKIMRNSECGMRN